MKRPESISFPKSIPVLISMPFLSSNEGNSVR
jgi:hypothetical protein